MSDDHMMADSFTSTSQVHIREDTLHLRGVDNLSTRLVKEYLERYVADRDFKIEWINDSSLNIIFDTPDEASESLVALTKEYEEKSLEPTVERAARIYDKTMPEIDLTIRIANTDDKKLKNASAYSRFYLINPEEQQNYRREQITYRNDDRTPEFREREKRRRKRAINDEGDLFPERVRYSEGQENPDLNGVSTDDNDLFSRIKPKADNNSDLFSRLRPNKERENDTDLFSRIGSEDTHAKSDLFSRIGSNK